MSDPPLPDKQPTYLPALMYRKSTFSTIYTVTIIIYYLSTFFTTFQAPTFSTRTKRSAPVNALENGDLKKVLDKVVNLLLVEIKGKSAIRELNMDK